MRITIPKTSNDYPQFAIFVVFLSKFSCLGCLYIGFCIAVFMMIGAAEAL
jgi:hypothetical protein